MKREHFVALGKDTSNNHKYNKNARYYVMENSRLLHLIHGAIVAELFHTNKGPWPEIVHLMVNELLKALYLCLIILAFVWKY